MENNPALPPELISAIGSETVDFTVKAKRIQPLKKSIGVFFMGIAWTLFSVFMLLVFIGPNLQGQATTMKINGVEKVVQPGDWGAIAIPGLMMGFFVLVGLIIIVSSIQAMIKEGGFFAGTPTRLVNYQKNNIRSIDWEQFTGDIKVNGKNEEGNIELQMRTGHMTRQKRGPSKFVPDIIEIAEIPNPFEVAELCRKRIKANDPTPPVAENNAV